MSDADDNRAVSECLQGHTDAFEILVDKYQTPVFNTALRIVKSHNDAEEITQIVFVKAFVNLKRFNAKYKFFSWIYRMTVNESLNFANQKKPHEALHPTLVSETQTPVESFQQQELSERVQDALMLLAVDYRVVIVLRHFEELSYQQISYILDLPEKTVKSRLFTARQLLKNILSASGVLEI